MVGRQRRIWKTILTVEIERWNSSASSIAVTADDVHGGSGALTLLIVHPLMLVQSSLLMQGGKRTDIYRKWVKATEVGEFNITVCSYGSGCDDWQIATGTESG